MVAIPVAAVFLVVLVRQLRQRNWRILGQFGGFAVICFPLGLWYPVRNLVRFGVPLTYVQEMPENSVQYLGNSRFSRGSWTFRRIRWQAFSNSGYSEPAAATMSITR